MSVEHSRLPLFEQLRRRHEEGHAPHDEDDLFAVVTLQNPMRFESFASNLEPEAVAATALVTLPDGTSSALVSVPPEDLEASVRVSQLTRGNLDKFPGLTYYLSLKELVVAITYPFSHVGRCEDRLRAASRGIEIVEEPSEAPSYGLMAAVVGEAMPPTDVRRYRIHDQISDYALKQGYPPDQVENDHHVCVLLRDPISLAEFDPSFEPSATAASIYVSVPGGAILLSYTDLGSVERETVTYLVEKGYDRSHAAQAVVAGLTLPIKSALEAEERVDQISLAVYVGGTDPIVSPELSTVGGTLMSL